MGLVACLQERSVLLLLHGNIRNTFHKVLSQIGSYTNIRGGNNYPSIIRKHKKKDIKIFMQDGSNDLNNEHGDWWLANLEMESALKFKGYEFKFEKEAVRIAVNTAAPF
jgi:hypothetical protein